ncbi:VirB family protein (plasmid) [Roseomonas mucosa]|uniref:TrbC/VirB2 family protein n=1 Tax=Roseomonas mucosa TaxID=207340 RepID=UPI00224743D8|nr:TrbC/VirB2 family protein [Roseomonas mucosa]UZO95031.1 VirB family protein [Roseomonas mucosa]
MNNAKRKVAVLASLPARLSIAVATAPDRLTTRADRLARGGLTAFALVAAMVLTAEPAYAQASGGGGDITTFLQNLVNLVTGTAGKLIAILAIAVTGILKMLGVASMRTLATVIFGVMLVFSASWIVSQITGAG